MRRLSAAISIVLVALAFTSVSGAAPTTSKRVGYPPKKHTLPTTTVTTTTTSTTRPATTTRPALGAPTDLRARLRYSDYRGATVELRWQDNSSAETEFVLTEATPGADCRTWPDHDVQRFPANTTSATWTVPPGSGRGIGLLNAHSILLGFKCPQDYTLVARNASGDSPASNIVVLDADSPNPPHFVRFDGTELRWRYDPKGYPMDVSGTTCFYANGVPICAAPCAWCWAGVYSRDGFDYVAVLSAGWFGGVIPACLKVSTVVGTDASPWAQYSGVSPTVSKCAGEAL